jgi:hypothetical protein
MDDLISRSAVLKYMETTEISQYIDDLTEGNDNYNSTPLYDFVKNMPVAFDIEKVKSELQEMIEPKQFYFCRYAKGGCKHLDNSEKDCMECLVEIAIDIVRKGGVE